MAENDEGLDELAELSEEDQALLADLDDDELAELAELAGGDEDGDTLTAEEAVKLKAELRRANKRAERLRKSLKSGKRPAKDDDADTGSDGDGVLKAAVIRHGLAAALAEAGAKPSFASRAHRLLDTDDVELTDDGDLVDPDGLVDELRDEWPEMFTTADDGKGRRPSPRRPKERTRGAGDGKKKEERTEDTLARMIRGESTDDD